LIQGINNYSDRKMKGREHKIRKTTKQTVGFELKVNWPSGTLWTNNRHCKSRVTPKQGGFPVVNLPRKKRRVCKVVD